MIQGSIEWHEEKLGKFSASLIHKIMGVKGIGQTGETYILEMVTEELTGLWNEINAPAIEWGNSLEPWAKEHYKKVFKVSLLEPAWKKICDHSGVSPDAIIKGQKKGIEIKCPYTRVNHTKHLLLKTQQDFKQMKTGSTSGVYYWQIQMQMLAYKFDKWDFVSYHPEFEGMNKMFVMEVKRNEDDIILLRQRLSESIVKKLNYLKTINL